MKRAALVLLILSGIVPFVGADIIVDGVNEGAGYITLNDTAGIVQVTESDGSTQNTLEVFKGDIYNSLTVEGGRATLNQNDSFNAQINISGGVVQRSNSGTFNKSLTVSGNGSATLYGGTFHGAITNSGGRFTLSSTSFLNTFNKSLTVSGGETDLYKATFNDTVAISAGKATIRNSSTFNKSLTVSGGEADLYGGTFNDTITISGGSATLNNWGTFNKSLTVSGGEADLYGGTFNDTITISEGTATIRNSSTFNKSLTVSGGEADLYGGTFNDTITISEGTATIRNSSTFNKSLTVSGGEATFLNGGTFKDTVTISGNGSATLNGGTFDKSVTVSGNGSAFLHGGNYNQSLTVSGGLLEADGEISINSGIYATGGEIILVDLEKLAGEISLYGDSVLRMYDTVDNFTVSLLTVDGTAKAYLGGEYSFSSGTQISESGQILSASGWILGANGSSINYTISGNGAIYVGQIPEPAAVCFICVAGLGFLIARRLFARFAEAGEAELATSTWPLTGDQLRMFVSEDFSGEESAEWDRVEWNRRECGWMLRITNQIPMPRLQFAEVPPVVEPPQVPEEPVPLIDPALIALPDRPRVRSIPFHVESFLWHAARNQHRQWNLSLCAE